MQDDGICHNLHCPGKIHFDRAAQERRVSSCPTGRSQRKLGRNDFCDMCISRKSLTTNLSSKM